LGNLAVVGVAEAAAVPVSVEEEEKEETTILGRACAVRTALLEGSSTSSPLNYHFSLAWDLLRQQALRLRDRAQALALLSSNNNNNSTTNGAWNQLRQLLDPMLEFLGVRQ
jgi:hypothetical protein